MCVCLCVCLCISKNKKKQKKDKKRKTKKNFFLKFEQANLKGWCIIHLFRMSSFEITITLKSSLSSQELADFFSALAKSEEGDVQPLVRILHPVEPPPPPAPVLSTLEPSASPATRPSEATPPPANVKNTQWERCNITLANEETVEETIQAITTGEFVSPLPSISWQGIKHSPRSQHNQRIVSSLRTATNRTLSFPSLGAQAGIPDKEKLKSYLREMEKQGLITATRRVL